MKRKLLALALSFALAFATAVSVSAAEDPYVSYTYNADGSERAAPALYLPEKAVDGKQLTGQAMVNPGDLFLWQDTLYILDSGGSRLILTDPDLGCTGTLTFTDEAGTPMQFTEAAGLFVGEEGIYLSDAGALKVYRFDHTGRLEQTYTQPDSPLYDKSIAFRVTRLLADSAGNLYALVEGQFSGAVMFSASGEFLGFYGPNEVEMTLDMLLDQSWRQVLSEEQQSAMGRFIPVAYTSFDIDEENFIYTCSKSALSVSSRVRRLNPSGKGLWDGKELQFGDDIPTEQWVSGLGNTTQLVDLDIGPDGMLSVLDAARGRVFQYDGNGQLLGAFGGRGSQTGTFQDPAAIESAPGRLYVLDKAAGTVTLFKTTAYGSAVHSAVDLYNQGEYEAAIPYWQQVIAMDGGSELACLGMGKACYAQGDVAAAMEYLRASNNVEQYSQVFENYRLQLVRGGFTAFVIVLAVVLAALAVLKRLHWFGLGAKLEPLRRHFRVLVHPDEALYELRSRKQLSPWFAAAVVGVWFLLEVLSWFATGFIFQTRDPEEFNLLFPVVSTIVAYCLWVLVNWAVSTLSDGKGTAKELWCASAYALLPYLFGKAAVLVLSHLLTQQEGAFLVWIQGAAFVWAVIVLFGVLTTLHHYTLGKALGSVALTLTGIVIVIFLLFMAVVLFDHVSNLFMIVYNELTLRR